jgi:lysozyme
MPNSQLEDCIIQHEGMKKSVYKDSRGYDTIGIGFLCDSRMDAGLSVEECMMILRSRIANLESRLSQYPWHSNQDEVRKGALVELSYNMGVKGLLKFVKFLAAMEAKDYLSAANELKDSLWAKQVGNARVANIWNRIRYGKYA